MLHCYYKDIYGIRPVKREHRNDVVWLRCGIDRPLSRDPVDRFLTNLKHIVDDAFTSLVEQAAAHGVLDLTHCIDSTDVRAMPADLDASECYDPTEQEYYYGYGCTIVLTGARISIVAEFTESKQAPEETAIWTVGDSAYDTLDWHDHLLSAGVVPLAPYNGRNTEDPKDIEYRAEDRITEHSEDVQLKQSTLDEMYNRRARVERTNESLNDCGPERTHVRGRVHARAQVFIALCLRLVIAITNYER